MLAQASTTMPYPSSTVAAALAEPAHPWAVSLDADGRAQLARIGVNIGRVSIYKQVRLEVGASTATLRSESVMLPVSWVALGGPPVFPKMEGTLHVEPDGAGGCKLTLNARYDPPMGKLGVLIDRALMHRIAQATMGDFVERLAGAVASELALGRAAG